MRCEGYRKSGGFMRLGPVSWEQCSNAAIVIIEVKQDDGQKSFPACAMCWQEAINTPQIEIIDVRPIIEKGGEE